jgi:hypothetical protein
MLHHNRPFALLLHLVLRPPGAKLRADLLEAVAEIGQHLAQPEIGEVIPDHMALGRWQGGPIRDQRLGAVPSQHTPAVVAQIGRIGLESRQQRLGFP